jgi:hypothetical protein
LIVGSSSREVAALEASEVVSELGDAAGNAGDGRNSNRVSHKPVQ